MKKGAKIFLGVLVLVGVIYAIGPTPEEFSFSTRLPEVTSIDRLEDFVNKREQTLPVKLGNEARIVWANDSLKNKTKYSFVYLHGFSASEKEGTPGHTNIAKQFGANLYLARLAGHGLEEDEPLITMTSSNLYASAQEALAIGKKLGENVILVGTSTGATLALMLAAEYEEVKGLILYSPNVEIYDPTAFLLNKPWGLEIAEQVLGSKYNVIETDNPDYPKYWNIKYRIEALVELQELLDKGMREEIFQKVTVPVYMAYYYKNEEEQDKTVSVPAMLRMYGQLGTPAEKRKKEAFPEAGSHVIASSLTSDQYKDVERSSVDFIQHVLGLQR